MLSELMYEMFTQSKILVLDFSKVRKTTAKELDIRQYFKECEQNGINPRRPENRQIFNDRVLALTGARYLVSQYVEDRQAMLTDTKIAQEGRTFHLGIDIFSRELEPVFAPCNGEIVEVNYEPGYGEYGHYLIFEPEDIPGIWFFYGHLGHDLSQLGKRRQGEKIGKLGDYIENENGGWSRHLHFQVMRKYSPSQGTPIGYSKLEDLAVNTNLFPSPMEFFPNWKPEYI